MVGSRSRAALTSPRMASGRAPSLLRTGTTRPSSCSSRTARRCSGVVSGWLRAAARALAASSAWRDLVVKRSSCIEISVGLTEIIAHRGRRPESLAPPNAHRHQGGARRLVPHDLGAERAADGVELGLHLGGEHLRALLE